jgi:hypothetical protein
MGGRRHLWIVIHSLGCTSESSSRVKLKSCRCSADVILESLDVKLILRTPSRWFVPLLCTFCRAKCECRSSHGDACKSLNATESLHSQSSLNTYREVFSGVLGCQATGRELACWISTWFQIFAIQTSQTSSLSSGPLHNCCHLRHDPHPPRTRRQNQNGSNTATRPPTFLPTMSSPSLSHMARFSGSSTKVCERAACVNIRS